LRKRNGLILFFIVIIGFTVRFWGIDFGLPHPDCRPDELPIINIALKFGTGDLNPHFFRYPSFYMYLLSSIFLLYFLFGRITNKYAAVQDFITEAIVNRSNFYLIDRCLSVFAGVATIFITYRICKYLFDDDDTALTSSFFVSLVYLHVRDSHFGVTDVFMTFLVVCSIFYIIKCYREFNIKNYVLAGIFGGLAMSTKYNGFLVIAPMFIVHYLKCVDGKLNFLKLLTDKKILFFVIFFCVGFLFGTPFAVIDHHKFMVDLLYEFKHLHVGHSINLGIGWWYHLKFSLFLGLGWSLLIFGLIGIFFFVRRDKRKALILCSFPLLYYILIGRGFTVFVRYVIPIVPFLCITAGLCVTHISGKLFGKNRRWRMWFTIFLSFLVILPSVCRVINFNKLLAKEDNRLIVEKWIDRNISKGATICQFTSANWDRLQLCPTIDQIEEKLKMYSKKRMKIDIMKTKAMLDYFIKNSIEGYRLFTYDEKSGRCISDIAEYNILPQYIVAPSHPLSIYSNIPEAAKEVLSSYYYLRKAFIVIDDDDDENLFDQSDAFYVPFSEFKNVERPGPNYYIYERIGLTK